MPHDTQFAPEEVEELKRLFNEHAPPDGVITYKGRKVRLKPPEAKTITVKEVSVTSKPHREGTVLHDAPVGSPKYMEVMRRAAAKRAATDPSLPADPKLLLHVDWPGDERPPLEGESILRKKEEEDKET